MNLSKSVRFAFNAMNAVRKNFWAVNFFSPHKRWKKIFATTSRMRWKFFSVLRAERGEKTISALRAERGEKNFHR